MKQSRFSHVQRTRSYITLDLNQSHVNNLWEPEQHGQDLFTAAVTNDVGRELSDFHKRSSHLRSCPDKIIFLDNVVGTLYLGGLPTSFKINTHD